MLSAAPHVIVRRPQNRKRGYAAGNRTQTVVRYVGDDCGEPPRHERYSLIEIAGDRPRALATRIMDELWLLSQLFFDISNTGQ